jgi:serine/threonine protein kinase
VKTFRSACLQYQDAEYRQRPPKSEEFMFAMKIENLMEPSEKERRQGVTKKQPVPLSQS